ncbi:phosphatase PAP2 family protein [Sporosarcina obsidiansis]|uniref:phosphatase PAP2 family protein n=1 Tax=Sporosarcina obsidiansis TaxID=2660748 RepID=UPI00189167CD|nr:phosphatase PAP2 family protein [Sporosarcina obsidiansis]
MRGLSFRLLLTWFICAVLTGLFAFVARSIHLQTITSFDESVIDLVQGTESPWLTTVMKIFTNVGSTSIVVLFSLTGLAWLYWKGYRAQAFLLVVVIAGTGIINQIMKFVFKRERPNFHRLIDIGGYSFPSGHTMMAFSLYTILAYIIWRNLRTTWGHVAVVSIATVMIMMIAVSRIYLGVHFPSDIVGGALASGVWLIASISIYQHYQRKRQSTLT